MAATPTTDPAAHGETTAATEHESSGLPQFDTTHWPGQIVWFLIIFAVLLFLMRNVFVRRIGGGIEDREHKISGDIAEAAADMARARAASQKVAQDARNKAQAEIAARLAEEEAKLAETVAAAEASIAGARGQAMGNVRSIAADTAQAIVEKLTGQAASAKEIGASAASRA